MEELKPKANRRVFRLSGGVICCGTLRIATIDFDTDPCEEVRNEILDDLAAALSDRVELARLRAENEALRSFKDAVIGWRENDWPEGFCRRTAELISENAKHLEKAND